MGSKTLVTVLVAVLLAGVSGWLLSSGNNGIKELPVSEVISVENNSNVTGLSDENAFPELMFDEQADETQIILVKPYVDELSNLLSEKVIRNDQIVDKSSTGINSTK